MIGKTLLKTIQYSYRKITQYMNEKKEYKPVSRNQKKKKQAWAELCQAQVKLEVVVEVGVEF